VDRTDNRKEVWVTCPHCTRVYNVETLMLTDPQWATLMLFCPFCQQGFDRSESPKIYGLA
jgi:hypothetical protein